MKPLARVSRKNAFRKRPSRDANLPQLQSMRQQWKIIRDGVGLARAKLSVLSKDLSSADVSMRPHYAGFDLEWAIRWARCANSTAGNLSGSLSGRELTSLRAGLASLNTRLENLYALTNRNDTEYSDYASEIEAAEALDPIWARAGEGMTAEYRRLGGDPQAIASISSRVQELRSGDANNPDDCPPDVTPSGAGHLRSEMTVSDEKVIPAGQAGT
jgi:hypothetical protein